MRAGWLLVFVGAALGAVAGFLGAGPAMLVAGGGYSHSDLFVAVEALLISAVLGAFAGPPFIGALLIGRERRRVDRANGVTPQSWRRPAMFSVGALTAVFGAFTTLYYSLVIAELPPALGGPTSNPDPAGRARWTMLVAGCLAITGLVLFIQAVHSLRGPSAKR